MWFVNATPSSISFYFDKVGIRKMEVCFLAKLRIKTKWLTLHVFSASSTIVSTNMLSSTTNPPSRSVLMFKNFGQPAAMFISFFGCWNEDEFLSVRNVSFLALDELSWFKMRNVTLFTKGHFNKSSYCEFMTTKKIDKCVPFPIPSPFKYNLVQNLYPKASV